MDRALGLGETGVSRLVKGFRANDPDSLLKGVCVSSTAISFSVQRIRTLGRDLTGATSAGFNGTAALFNVVPPTENEARVPDGAATGFITVTAPAALKSNLQIPSRAVKPAYSEN